MITPIQFYQNSVNLNKKPSFGSVHPARYFIKEGESFIQIDSYATIKLLHRRLITLLNKDFNIHRKRVAGHCYTPPKPEKPEQKALREKLTRFFMKNDSDFTPNSEVRTFNTTNSLNELEPYILTGESAQKAKTYAKDFIGSAWRKSNDKAEVLSDNLGITFEKAKESIIKETAKDVSYAKRSYHFNLLNDINSELSRGDLKNSRFDAFFVPKAKGKNVAYELVDARLNGASWTD